MTAATNGATAPGSAAAPGAAGPGGAAPAALAVENVSWHAGAVPIISDVTLGVAPGELVALIGPNGAGKTSLFNVVSGLNRPSGGRVLLGGADVTRLAPYRRARLGLGRTFQTSAVFGSLSATENVALAVQAARGGSMRPWLRRADRSITAAADEILQQVSLAPAKKAGELSHGEKRKLEIALLLATAPKMLLLDEPMAGVSAEDVPALAEVIRGLTGDGRGVLMVEHHMDVVLDLADRVAVMHHGTLLACDSPGAVMADATVQEAYLGEAL